MKERALLVWVVVVIVVGSGACVAQAPVNEPSFTISASNVTMPSNGNGSIPFTLTSVNGFARILLVSCMPPTPAAGVNEPNCGNYGPLHSYSLVANGTTQGMMSINADAPLPSPSVARLHRSRHGEGAGWTLAGALMLGIGLRRRRLLRPTERSVAGLLLLVGTLIGLSGLGIAGCGSAETLTPGVYTYTLTAITLGTSTDPVLAESTTVQVTVPPGVVVQKNVPVPLATQ